MSRDYRQRYLIRLMNQSKIIFIIISRLHSSHLNWTLLFQYGTYLRANLKLIDEENF